MNYSETRMLCCLCPACKNKYSKSIYVTQMTCCGIVCSVVNKVGREKNQLGRRHSLSLIRLFPSLPVQSYSPSIFPSLHLSVQNLFVSLPLSLLLLSALYEKHPVNLVFFYSLYSIVNRLPFSLIRRCELMIR